jgi:hydroxymethylbilane synthase
LTTSSSPSTVRIATRGSALALWQAQEVARLLETGGAGVRTELVVVETAGDRRLDLPVWELGGQGVFVKEVQAAVLEGRADLAVHSAKDLPSSSTPGLSLEAFPVRADPRDALVGSTLEDLAPGALVATGSVRRRAQLAWLRPDLTFTGLRGNIATRLERVPPGGAVVVAAAALARLGWSDRAAQILDVAQMLPQVGQGAMGIECRSDDCLPGGPLRQILASVDDPDTRDAVVAERAFLSRLGGGCDLPVGAYAHLEGSELEVEGLLASLDGRTVIRMTRRGPRQDGARIGDELAGQLLAHGGADLLSGGEGTAREAGL